MEGVGVFFQREKDELSKYCSRLDCCRLPSTTVEERWK